MKNIWILFPTLVILFTGCHQKSPEMIVPEAQVSTFIKKGGYITFDAMDNLYLGTYHENTVLKVSPSQILTTFAGSSNQGLRDGSSTQAQFTLPQGLFFDKSGNLYVGQSFALRKITTDGMVTTVAGTSYANIDFTRPDSILFVTTPALVMDASGNLLVADYTDGPTNARILKVTPDRQVSVYLGIPFYLSKNVPPYPTPQIKQPVGLAFDSKGNLFIADHIFGIIKVTPDKKISYIAGVGQAGFGRLGHVDGPASVAQFNGIQGLAIDKSDNLYVGDDVYVRKITPDAVVSTVAGSGIPIYSPPSGPIYKDGPGSQAQFLNPYSLAFDSKGDLYVADGTGIRKIVLAK